MKEPGVGVVNGETLEEVVKVVRVGIGVLMNAMMKVEDNVIDRRW